MVDWLGSLDESRRMLQVHAYLRALIGARAHRVGPFLASIDDHDAGPFRNYAVPDDGADPTPDQIEHLATVFTDRRRTPRLEYLPGLCPRVEPALLAAGFTQERRLPVMTCRPADAVTRPVNGEIELILATSEEQLRQVAEAPNDAYGQPETTEHDVARLRGTVGQRARRHRRSSALPPSRDRRSPDRAAHPGLPHSRDHHPVPYACG